MRAVDGESGEHRIAVGRGLAHPDRPHGHAHAEAIGQLLGLRPEDLLDAHQVGVDLLQDAGDSVQVDAAVQPLALVDVVAGDAELHRTAGSA